MGKPLVRRALSAAVLALLTTGAAVGTALVPTPGASAAAGTTGVDDPIYLVTLRGPGTAGYRGPVLADAYRDTLEQAQDATLTRLGLPEPVYRWTTALNGFAVALDAAQARRLSSVPDVVRVERNSVRRLSGAARPARSLPVSPAGRGGAGVVVGLVDTGIWPESSLFASVPGLGRRPAGFHGECQTGAGFGAADCNDKLVGARWFVEGFGRDRLRTSSSLSPRDDSGHGTQMASIAAGNAGVSVKVPGLRARSYTGVAPRARIAVYKACWAAPDPADDGCATADLVTAIDAATRDGVDVLNLSVGGPPEIDTVERALLGATEAGAVVLAAAGNGGRATYAAHPSPWVTTVGATTGERRRGRIKLPGGASVEGAMASSRAAGPARLVVGRGVPAADATEADAALCRPGSLDASRTRDAIVLCERGGSGRVEKSQAVAQADGVGLILVNRGRGSVESDLHTVPTVHVSAADGRRLRDWQRSHPQAEISLTPLGLEPSTPRVTTWSPTGDPTGAVVKPDVVAPGTGVLGAVPPTVRGTRWDFASGTSVATAWTSGLALRMLSAGDWPADVVRSALATGASPLPGSPSALREGAGLPSEDATRPVLAYRTPVGAYRGWLAGTADDDPLNAPSVLLSRADSTATRQVTNVSDRRLIFRARVSGLTDHTVEVSPATVTLRPGESATFRIQVSGPDSALDDGWLAWDSVLGSHGRIRIALTR